MAIRLSTMVTVPQKMVRFETEDVAVIVVSD